jgi:hypothetical protein
MATSIAFACLNSRSKLPPQAEKLSIPASLLIKSLQPMLSNLKSLSISGAPGGVVTAIYTSPSTSQPIRAHDPLSFLVISKPPHIIIAKRDHRAYKAMKAIEIRFIPEKYKRKSHISKIGMKNVERN